MREDASVSIILPAMGESVTEGIVARWLKAVGDPVEEGETVVEVTTDKVDVEVPAPAAGVLQEISAAEGVTVPVGGAMGTVGRATTPEHHPATPREKSTGKDMRTDRTPLPDTTAAVISASNEIGADPHDVFISPLARRAAAVQGVDVSTVVGSAPGGAIRRSDISQPKTPHPTIAAIAPQGSKKTPLKGAEKALAGHMDRSKSMPTATSFRALAVQLLENQRSVLNSQLATRARVAKISFTHLIAYAIAKVAGEMPGMASFYAEEDGVPMRVFHGVHLGLAVDVTRNDGTKILMVPVIHHADDMSFAAFHDEYERLVAAARTNTLSPDDMQGATLTITNPGGLGTVASVPRLMVGQGAIIAVGAIAYPAEWSTVPVETVASLGISKVMTMTSTYDHRIIQGAESGTFLRAVEQLLRGERGFYDAIAAAYDVTMPPIELQSELQAELATVARSGSDRGTTAVPSSEVARVFAGAMQLIESFRRSGHLAAQLDPLKLHELPLRRELTLAGHGLRPEDALPAYTAFLDLPSHVRPATAAELLLWLQKTYCGTAGYEVEHLTDELIIKWVQQRVEDDAIQGALQGDEVARRILEELVRAHMLEEYLRKTFLGEKTFSLEGLDAVLALLIRLFDHLIADDASDVVLGMAHRGRQSIISRAVTQSYDQVLRAYQFGNRESTVEETGSMGDVKYHLSGSGTYAIPEGGALRVHLLPNPSHLEAVDPVVEGWTRALQTDHSAKTVVVEPRKACAVLIHGDAAMAGQGIVAETLNLAALTGYTTGGTIHVIANNQVGFTTNPEDGRSTTYASDIAKGFDIPVIHVNADDIEAVLRVVELAMAYRTKFQKDIVIDCIGYRRFGHNENDEPVYTQPLMYAKIREHQPVYKLYAAELISRGVIPESAQKEMEEAALTEIKLRHAVIKNDPNAPIFPNGHDDVPEQENIPAVPKAALLAYHAQLTTYPGDLDFNQKLLRQLERRKSSLDDNEIDFGTAESLAFASILSTGRPIRLSGQDTLRGTFSHRHMALYAADDTAYLPIQHLDTSTASMEALNSPLSEGGCIGFEYGYSVATPSGLILWEAQFGDFINNAQVLVDQFIATGRMKWAQESRLTLLLPHGYEGMGPEHSSGRMERFLILSAHGNIRVANCSTAGQYYHLLRDQALRSTASPLVVFTPKSLLRKKAAASTVADLVQKVFEGVIDDPLWKAHAKNVQRVIFCSGKLYYDLVASAGRDTTTAIVRIEMLHPFPTKDVRVVLQKYAAAREIIWAQEEPENMGAWVHVEHEFGLMGAPVMHASRPRRASAAEGSEGIFEAEQKRVIQRALGTIPTLKAKGSR